jgi:hypothetical protein
MDTEGVYAPETVERARARYDSLGSTAQIVVKETAKAMELSNEEYDERVTSSVVETARDALFASLLEVTHGSREEFETWRDEHPETTVDLVGSDNVDSVAWHRCPFEETVIAATYQNEPDAAAATVRRRAFGEQYRPIF